MMKTLFERDLNSHFQMGCHMLPSHLGDMRRLLAPLPGRISFESGEAVTVRWFPVAALPSPPANFLRASGSGIVKATSKQQQPFDTVRGVDAWLPQPTCRIRLVHKTNRSRRKNDKFLRHHHTSQSPVQKWGQLDYQGPRQKAPFQTKPIQLPWHRRFVVGEASRFNASPSSPDPRSGRSRCLCHR